MLLSAQKEYVIDEYRPTLACHASTVLPLENGEVLAAWFGGTAEGKDDVDIYVSRRVGALWYPPQRISAGDVPHWNPVLFRGADGRIILYFKAGKPIPQWQTYFCESADGGKTWSAPAELVPGDTSGGRGPVKNKPLRLADGTILAPASTEQGAWLAFIDVSRDDGRTWTRTPNIPAPRYKSGRQIAMIQPTLWESAPNAVHALFRTNRGRIYRSDSADGGKSWCEAYPTVLKNPNSAVRQKLGRTRAAAAERVGGQRRDVARGAHARTPPHAGRRVLLPRRRQRRERAAHHVHLPAAEDRLLEHRGGRGRRTNKRIRKAHLK